MSNPAPAPGPGRPKGSKNYNTPLKDALFELADKNPELIRAKLSELLNAAVTTKEFKLFLDLLSQFELKAMPTKFDDEDGNISAILKELLDQRANAKRQIAAQA
jgi:hypothetical protein